MSIIIARGTLRTGVTNGAVIKRTLKTINNIRCSKLSIGSTIYSITLFQRGASRKTWLETERVKRYRGEEVIEGQSCSSTSTSRIHVRCINYPAIVRCVRGAISDRYGMSLGVLFVSPVVSDSSWMDPMANRPFLQIERHHVEKK